MHIAKVLSMKRIPTVVILLVVLMSAVGVLRPVQAQTPTPPPQLESMLSSMTPEERVGQLFLVTFTGTDTSDESQIYDLIRRHHVGGVVLLTSNDNFMSSPGTLAEVHALITRLQQIEHDGSITQEQDSGPEQSTESTYIPLFIGLTKEGSLSPADQILTGLTPLPSQMAIGASWNTDFATQVGAVQGRELAVLGFNLFFGPSLDVLEFPNPSANGDLGTFSFGGDPFWVGEMGRAYITGLHEGSSGRMLVVSKHFPGSGGSDRPPEDEIATVRKSLEQLKQIELAPFFAVTGDAPTPEAVVDGLLVSHIRYQGFQGNIRATTRPVSFDAQALSDILALSQFATWRANGGLIVSDDLGTRAVRDFYIQGGEMFSARFATRDAFLAGNDLLYLGKIVSGDAEDTYSSTVKILDFFAQKYREDPAFAQQVDAAVRRILTKKYNLYGGFNYTKVQTPVDALASIGNSEDITFDVARDSATLVSPGSQDLATVFPSPPQVRDRTVFITDTMLVKQCSTCLEQASLPMDALEQAIIRLYGPEAGNETSDFRLSSHSLQSLQDFLDGLQPPFIETDIIRANWVIISITGSNRGQPALVSRFLRERQDLLRDKHIILFSFGAPYYFDSTDLSNITAYFALYSYQPPFVDVAARLLFKELTPTGASPVSIPSVGYDLISAMAADPDQLIPLSLDLPPAVASTDMTGTPEPTPTSFFRIGDTINIRTGVIYDHNGHSVPDGTVVQFSMNLTGEGGGIVQQVEATTTQGVARASFGLDKPGLIQIRAASEPAKFSQVLQLDVSQSGAVVTVVVPQLTESVEPAPVTPEPPPENEFVTPEGYPRFSAWFLSMFIIAFSTWVGYWFSKRFIARKGAVRFALGTLLGGLFAYNYLVLGMPGGSTLLTSNGVTGVLVIVLFGELLGSGAGLLWARK
jgi:beta-N-acetylhexosaminidase